MGEDAECKQGLVQGCEDLQKQRRTMERDHAEEWRSKSTVYVASGAKCGPEVERSLTELMDGRRRLRSVCSDSKERRGDNARMLHQDSGSSNNDLEKDEASLLV